MTIDSPAPGETRYYLTYSGVKLPFNLVTPLGAGEVENRNTYFKGYFDADRLLGFDKMVYGEVELAHRYAYHDTGALKRAEITDIDGDTTVLEFADISEPGLNGKTS
jgi:hypothetical protein